MDLLGRCGYCNEECNPHSQSCGRCMRNLTGYSIGTMSELSHEIKIVLESVREKWKKCKTLPKHSDIRWRDIKLVLDDFEYWIEVVHYVHTTYYGRVKSILYPKNDFISPLQIDEYVQFEREHVFNVR